MNEDKYCSSDKSSSKVISKYFLKQSGMDESLEEFQEKTKTCTGPKKLTKIKENSKRKIRKKGKGQTDIRVLIESRNELISYAKEFKKVCLHSDIDVDSEQLQLAIALSRSLQEVKHNDIVSSELLTSREQKIAIKKTLEEYGFTVPKDKILVSNKRKKSKKNYSLLTRTDTEKQQIIAKRYNYILKNNLHSSQFPPFYYKSPNPYINEIKEGNTDIYYKTTNICYEEIKNIDTFYVPGLVPKSIHLTSMLRDWSEIPGRPVSPKRNINDLNIFECEFSQEQLDCILCYPLRAAQDIIKNQFVGKDFSHSALSKNILDKSTVDPLPECLNISLNLLHDQDSKSEEGYKKTVENNINSITQMDRSVSPDLFDEDEVYIVDAEDANTGLHKISVNSTHVNIECMDLTECVNINNTNQHILQTNMQTEKKLVISTQENASSKVVDHKDLLEYQLRTVDLETCDAYIGTSKLFEEDKFIDNFKPSFSGNINFTDKLLEKSNCLETVNKTNDYMELTNCVNSQYNSNHCVNKNVMRQNISIDLTKTVIVSENKWLENHCNYQNEIRNKSIIDKELIDLTQSSDSNEELPKVQLSGTPKERSFDNTSYLNDDKNSYCNLSDHKDFRHDNKNECNIYIPDEVNNDQSVNISVDYNRDCTMTLKNSVNTEGFGKEDNISIDYDELFDNIVSGDKISISTSGNTEAIVLNNILDKDVQNKFETSKHLTPASTFKNKDNFNFGGISIVEDDHEVNNLCFNPVNNSECNSEFVPTVEVKDKSEPTKTPLKIVKVTEELLQTPANKEYIIKDTNVTPALNYELMSTPERNRELEKHGIKPFKRKRALQLLTYIYNQTHPTVEKQAADGLPSTSKKIKTNDADKLVSSPKKTQFAGTYDGLECKGNNIYMETKQCPDIRDLDCIPEDWVFQTREKSKVHSCRIPLHIVFHNYVSCRTELRAAILRYDPVSIDTIHKDIVASGYRYSPKDLLRYLDRKCITVKTVENKPRTKKL